MASTYLERNMTGNTASTKMTFSCWLKISNPSTNGRIFGAQANACHSYFGGNGKLNIDFSAKDSGSVSAKLETNRLFRDTNAWYHIVFALDTTLGTADDRIKFYVNGVQETSFNSRTNPGQNDTYAYGQNGYYNVGARSNNTGSAGHYFDGLMSHVHYCDGYAYTPSDFGSTDSVTGEWKINASPSVSYGTNGFFILKDSNSGTDQSGNSNNFTVSGDLTKTEDCPSNIYATANPLVRNQVTITTANLTVRSPGSTWMGIPATLGVESGKWYWEYKLALGNAWSQCGVMSSKPNGGYDSIYSTYVGNNSGGLALNSGNGDFYHDGSSGAYGTSAWFSGGLAEYDIIGVALDATNNKIWFSQNGTWGNSSNPSTGSGGIDFSGDTDFTNYKPYFPAFSVHNCILTLNFGNGHLGTAEITTNGGNGFQDTDGNGRFYYAVPTNYRGLSTKGLNA